MPRQTVEINDSIGQRIRQTRLGKGWSIKDLARVSDVSTKWISHPDPYGEPEFLSLYLD